MDVTTVVLGAAMLVYGLYGLALYMLGKAEQKFKKLAPMRQKWGTKAGTAIHCFFSNTSGSCPMKGQFNRPLAECKGLPSVGLA